MTPLDATHRRHVRPAAAVASLEMGECESAPDAGVNLSHHPIWEGEYALLQGAPVDGHTERFRRRACVPRAGCGGRDTT